MLLPAGAIVQLLLDQGVFAPLFLATFISALFTIEVRGCGTGAQRARRLPAHIDDIVGCTGLGPLARAATSHGNSAHQWP